ncbi:MAG: ribonuclease P protein component [Alphaproteobacteria bacterium]|nr:ribonuclease P protein component [Alphaproteobacteria bacterium]
MLADTHKSSETGVPARKLRDVRLARMKKRADFQRLTASPNKYFTPSLVIQTAACRQLSRTSEKLAPKKLRPEQLTSVEFSESHSDDVTGKLGFTASRKVGNAVMRNRAKRRMRAASDRIMGGRVRQDWDFVLVARQSTATRPWAELLADLESGLRKLRAFS